MKKFINIFIILLVLAAIIVLGVIIYRYSQYQANSNAAIEVVAQIEKEFEEISNRNTKNKYKISYIKSN